MPKKDENIAALERVRRPRREGPEVEFVSAGWVDERHLSHKLNASHRGWYRGWHRGWLGGGFAREGYEQHWMYRDIMEQVEEEEYHVKSQTIENACKIADALPEPIRDELEAYPMYDGDVYVKARNERGDHVTVICQDGGSVIHRFNLNNYHEYPTGDMIDFRGVRMTFEALGPWGGTDPDRQ